MSFFCDSKKNSCLYKDMSEFNFQIISPIQLTIRNIQTKQIIQQTYIIEKKNIVPNKKSVRNNVV